ncbi:hypothetical protein [Methanosarcina barkeri]|uniref:hypothetical protein n=1 Tax=Methanosarcina barkeri TaxID=2208 RepID=UPI000AAF4C49|nr:hypothetical protein [Methanosarcina barkeri]
MDRQTYQTIYSSLHDFKDVFRLSEEYSKPVGVLATILNQKVVKKDSVQTQKSLFKGKRTFFKMETGTHYS